MAQIPRHSWNSTVGRVEFCRLYRAVFFLLLITGASRVTLDPNRDKLIPPKDFFVLKAQTRKAQIQIKDGVIMDTLERNIKAASKSANAENVLAKVIRITTIPPIMATALFTVLYFKGGVFENIFQFICAVFFLAVLPTLAYPLQRFIPPFKHEEKRTGQRNLALIMSNVGYFLSIVYSLVFHVSTALLSVFLTYLVSGMLLLVVNKLFGLKASGHACGIMGPMTALSYLVGWQYFLLGTVLLILMIWSSL